MSPSFRTLGHSPTAVADQLPRFLLKVDEARQTRQEHCERLLKELVPLLQEAEIFERKYERQRAPRFNTFNYLRGDELGLSHVIADLLDPRAEHGQGTSFLEAMLDVFPETRGWLDELSSAVAKPIRVTKECRIPEDRRIDITVDIPSATGPCCLAFENKPYANDQPCQVMSYLRYLRKQYGERFLLVYLPPEHRWPDEISLPRAEREKWQEYFSIMPYIGEGTSLQKWFAACQKVCNSRRVRWFLKDAQTFCQQQFGMTSMSNNPDVRFVQKYLSENPSQLSAAHAIHGAWIPVRDEMCKRFLEHLRKTVDNRVREEFGADFNVRCHYGGEKRWTNWLWISRDDWVQYDDVQNYEDRCTQIMLESNDPGPNGWMWGVVSPKPVGRMSEKERARRENISLALKNHGLTLVDNSDWWLQSEQLQRYRNWDPILPELVKECKKGNGPITDFYVDRLLEIARCAIPVISEVETVK